MLRSLGVASGENVKCDTRPEWHGIKPGLAGMAFQAVRRKVRHDPGSKRNPLAFHAGSKQGSGSDAGGWSIMPTERTARSDRPCQIHEIRLNPVPFTPGPKSNPRPPDALQTDAGENAPSPSYLATPPPLPPKANYSQRLLFRAMKSLPEIGMTPVGWIR